MAQFKLAIFDLDNTLYREPPTLSRACEVAMARAAADIVPGLTYDEALAMAGESNLKSGSVAAPFYERYALSHADLHERYHKYVDHLVLPRCENTKAAFSKIDREKTLLGVLTHGSRGWVDRVLDHLGLTDFFDSDLVVPFEEPGYHFKHDSEIPFLHLISKAEKKCGQEIDPAEVLMADDLEKNLAMPHKMGMTTVLVLHGREAGRWPHVGHQCEAVTEVLEKFVA